MTAVDVLDLLLAVSTLLTKDTSNFAAREGMTPARLHLLWELAAEGATQPHLLAGRLGVAARTVTGLVDHLVESGHVARAPHPEDRRSTLVILTPQGEAFAERLRQMRANLARQLCETMPDNRVGALREDLEVVLSRLQRLLDA
ncbi:MAG: MarR family transcriptional regulator [Pseudonocardiaceae bacterium]|nr:MarR family transcriptional regulator [Pseudonocardiaceae bacterium]